MESNERHNETVTCGTCGGTEDAIMAEPVWHNGETSYRCIPCQDDHCGEDW